jgi:protein gp37
VDHPTWQVVTGCAKVSPGCDRCYAEALTRRFAGVPGHPFTTGFAPTVHPDRVGLPLTWRTPHRVFVGALGDLFHDEVPDEFLAQVWAVMAVAHRHTFQVLTKRHARMRSLLTNTRFWAMVCEQVAALADQGHDVLAGPNPWQTWPLPNVWLGVSAETQQWADIRIPALLHTPAALRWVSAEPLLGPVDLSSYLDSEGDECGCDGPCPVGDHPWVTVPSIGWVVVGGESGAGARPVDPVWVENIVGDCDSYEVPVYVKQLGGNWARQHGLKGRGCDPDQWPPSLRIRQFPQPDPSTTPGSPT